MLIKSLTVLQSLAQHREEVKRKAITRKQWINADRLVMIIIFISVIVAAAVFS